MPIYTITGYKCSSEKLQGVTIDNTLSWDIQVENVFKKCNTYLLLLSRIKQFLSIDSRTLFYNAYILPHLDYCCVIWGNCSRSLVDPFHISIFSVKMDDFPRKSYIPESCSKNI